jgi:hypothetical protein
VNSLRHYLFNNNLLLKTKYYNRNFGFI